MKQSIHIGRWYKGFWLLVSSFLFCSCTTQRPETIQGKLTIATGPSQLVYHRLGNQLIKSLSELHYVKIQLRQTSGTQENIRLMRNSRVDMAFLQGDIAADLWQSKQQAYHDWRLMLVLHHEYFYMVVAGHSRLQSVSELKGQRIAVIGGKDSGSYKNLQMLLGLHGIRPKEVTLQESPLPQALQRLQRGELQAVFFIAGKSVPLLNQHGGTSPKAAKLRLLPVTKRPRKASYYEQLSLTSQDYPFLARPVQTLAVRAVLVCHKELRKDLVRGIAGYLLSEQGQHQLSQVIPGHVALKAELTRKFKEKYPILLHPAVKVYYHGTGWYARVALIFAAVLSLLMALVAIFFWKAPSGRYLYLVMTRWMLQRGFWQNTFMFVGLLLVTWVIGGSFLFLMEKNLGFPQGPYATFPETLKTSINIFTSGLEQTLLPKTWGGWVTSMLMVAGWGLCGVLYGAIQTSVVVHIRTSFHKGSHTSIQERNHVVIVGWNAHVPDLILQIHRVEKRLPIVVVTKCISEIPERLHLNYVRLLYGDPQAQSPQEEKSALERANLKGARSVLLVPDEGERPMPGPEEAGSLTTETPEHQGQHSEAQLFLRTLAVSRYLKRVGADKVRIVVQCHHQATIPRLARLGVDEVIHVQTFARKLMAQVAVTPLVSRVFRELLELGRHADIYRIDLENLHVPKCSFVELFKELYKEDIMLLGVIRKHDNRQTHPYEHFYRDDFSGQTGQHRVLPASVSISRNQGEIVDLLPLETLTEGSHSLSDPPIPEEQRCEEVAQRLANYRLLQDKAPQGRGNDVALLVMARHKPKHRQIEKALNRVSVSKPRETGI